MGLIGFPHPMGATKAWFLVTPPLWPAVPLELSVSPCLYGQLFLWNCLVTLLLYISGRDILFGQLSQ